MTTKGIYHTLVTQLDKLARHNRQGSFRTKDRYYEAVKRFCAYLAVHYHLQKLENISGKHLVSYVLYLQEQGKSASTIKTDLSAIRFSHDKTPLDAHFTVSRLLGHERPDVTNIYLASVKGGTARGE